MWPSQGWNNRYYFWWQFYTIMQVVCATNNLLLPIVEWFYFFLRFYLFIFRERGREREREGEKHQCVVASHVAPTGDLACNTGMCPDWESNQRPFGSQPTLNLSYTSQGNNLHFKSMLFLTPDCNEWLGRVLNRLLGKLEHFFNRICFQQRKGHWELFHLKNFVKILWCQA